MKIDHFAESFSDSDFKNSFKTVTMKTNLAEIVGVLSSELAVGLNKYSMTYPEKRILELVLNSHTYVFKNVMEVQQVMQEKMYEDRTLNALVRLGKHDMRCTVEWLVKRLFMLNEINILGPILQTGPPWIEKLNKEGDEIVFLIKSISPFTATWEKDNMDIKNSSTEYPEFWNDIIKYKPIEKGTYRLRIQLTKPPKEYYSKEAIYGGEIENSIIPYSETIRDRKRLALFIGICTYSTKMKLRASRTDLPLLDKTFRKIGFEVYSFYDITLENFKKLLKRFIKLIVKDYSYVFFYFSGHGMSKDSEDYACFKEETEIIRVKDILDAIISAKPGAFVPLFDICRYGDENVTENGVTKYMNYQHPKMLLLYSTLPNHLSYEKKYMERENKEHESTSEIIQPLVDCLENHACREGISDIMLKFIKLYSPKQTPSMASTTLNVVLGTDQCHFPQSIISRLTLNGRKPQHMCFKARFNLCIFYNLLDVSVEDMENAPSYLLRYKNGEWSRNYEIDLFEYFKDVKGDCNIVELEVSEKMGQTQMGVYKLEIYLPNELSCFYKD